MPLFAYLQIVCCARDQNSIPTRCQPLLLIVLKHTTYHRKRPSISPSKAVLHKNHGISQVSSKVAALVIRASKARLTVWHTNPDTSTDLAMLTCGRTLETARLTVGAVRAEGPPLKVIATEMCRERITMCPADRQVSPRAYAHARTRVLPVRSCVHAGTCVNCAYAVQSFHFSNL